MTTVDEGLRQLSAMFAATFACRAAMRILPVLADTSQSQDEVAAIKELSLYARNDVINYLFALQMAQWVVPGMLFDIVSVSKAKAAAEKATQYAEIKISEGKGYPCKIGQDGTSIAAAAAFSDVAACTAATATAAAAAAMAKTAANSPFATEFGAVSQARTTARFNAKTALAKATNSARMFSVDRSNRFLLALKDELNSIKGQKDVISFFQRPLWPGGSPDVWKVSWSRFRNMTLNVDGGFELWLNWYEDRVNGAPLDVEQLRIWLNVPIEIETQGPAVYNAYLVNLDKAEKPLNQVRALFIGCGGAGKTSLIRTLHGEPVQEGKEDMTPGIDIRSWPVGSSGIQAHLWDFGGQVMAHATHQFFLRERCLYVVVLDGRTEINANEQAEYWLEHVRAFGNCAPVLLVGNKSDQIEVKLDMATLREKYPNIIQFYPMSCTKYQSQYWDHFVAFREGVLNGLQAVGTHQVMFTDQHFAVLQKICQHSPKAAFLKYTDYEKICSEEGVGEEGVQNRAWLLDLLDKLGVVIHFPTLPYLDCFILNPRWLTYGVYTLLYSNEANESRGELSEQDIVRILRREKVQDELGNSLNYPAEKCRVLIDAMKQFQLCYTLPANQKRLVIPALLPAPRPDFTFDKSTSLAFTFEFKGFLPRHLMSALIVNRHDEIVKNRVWQNGVVLSSVRYRAECLIQVDYHERNLSMWIEGEDVDRFFIILHDEVSRILRNMSKLRFDEWVELRDDMMLSANSGRSLQRETSSRAHFRQLLAMEARGRKEYDSELGDVYDIESILQIMPEGTRKRLAKTGGKGPLMEDREVMIFISYAHEDEAYLKDLCTTLKGIQRRFPNLDWWHDRCLYAGKWEKQILSALDGTDIVILLISRSFIASDYCYGVEMKNAFLKYNERGDVVIPIIIRATNEWQRLPIGKFQALPKDGKPADEWKNPDRFWADVDRGLTREIERILSS